MTTSKRIAVLALGGTIAMTRHPDGSLMPALSADDLLSAVPELAGLDVVVDVHKVIEKPTPGASLTWNDLLAIAAEADRLLSTGAADGVVVTQGTDTIEETAGLLDLVHRQDGPVVVTGAMRGGGVAGADGPANVLAAVQVAASDQAGRRGCLVVFADEIYPARGVRKIHTVRTQAFTTPTGPVGQLIEGVPTFFHAPAAPRQAVPRNPWPTPTSARTVIATIGLDHDPDLLDLLGGHVDGMVIAAFGAGHVPANNVPVLAKLATRIPVVLSTRVAAGPVLSRTYGFAGSERDLLEHGLISGGTMSAVQGRTLLQLLLMSGMPHDQVANAFAAEQDVY